MKTLTLNNGIEMPILGLGVYQMDDMAECEQAVVDAISVGYRLIDTAAVYMNEAAVGRAIKRSGIAREELFITTKLWTEDTGYEPTLKAFEKSLSLMDLTYIDLYLIHQPYGDVYGSWRAMEKLYKEGKIRAIGVSNFHPDRIMDFLCNNEIPPTVNQIETHPFNQQFDNQAFLSQNNIQIESWAPFAEGEFNIFENETLKSIAGKYQKSVAQVILRSFIQRNVVVIPKSVHKHRIIENFDVFDFELSQEDLSLIAALDLKRAFVDHRDPKIVKEMTDFKMNM